ncbi:transmembrane protein 244-like isoform X2 [Stylophora pistillata]|uniref:transmembrane protein 244-like isoform X2 n=1 Tax=Stylophora pistillata TaxID=50429 RepID=UPI000C053FB5|nr:transmembrane protein 244-like isoform X2 [Stylophora pistillata]
MAEDTRVICLNLCIALPLFFVVYYMVASLLSGAFKVSDFDGKMPFDFQNCCDMKDNRNIVTLLSLLLTYTLTAIIFIIFLRKRIWDYAITIGFVHLLLTCAVMQAFPTNWKWWIAFRWPKDIKMPCWRYQSDLFHVKWIIVRAFAN